jgi:hypothetical protein
MAERMLLVNGPGKGQVIDWDSYGVRYADSSPAAIGAGVTAVIYRPVKVILFGHLVRVGWAGPGDPDEAALFELLTSAQAREVAVPLPRYRCAHQAADTPCLAGCHDGVTGRG